MAVVNLIKDKLMLEYGPYMSIQSFITVCSLFLSLNAIQTSTAYNSDSDGFILQDIEIIKITNSESAGFHSISGTLLGLFAVGLQNWVTCHTSFNWLKRGASSHFPEQFSWADPH